MNGIQREAEKLARQVRKGIRNTNGVEVALAPPFTALSTVHKILKGSRVALGAQNSHWAPSGAFTGEISPKMIKELGCKFAIIGHSERRQLFFENDEMVAKRLAACVESGIKPILCVGETLQQRKMKETKRIISRQLRVALKGITKSGIKNLEIAYEPVWAIGTGRNASPEQVTEGHAWIRKKVKELFGIKSGDQCRILYGGSVRPDNATDILRAPEVDGLLVGGASLKAQDFLQIIRSVKSAR